MKNKSSQQRLAEAAVKYASNISNGILSIDVCQDIALGHVSKWIDDQDDSISAERIVFVARAASDLIRNNYRILASL